MIATLAVALLLLPGAGSIECRTDLPPAVRAYTYPDTRAVQLAGPTCFGAWVAGLSPSELAWFRGRHPAVDVDRAEGEALLVLLHEGAHVAGVEDETDAECRALGELDATVGELVPPARRFRVAEWARRLHMSLGPPYRSHPC